jgi:hypothetical protein
MPCPHLKQVVMLYCDAYAVKKMVPLDRIVSAEPCVSERFGECPLFRIERGGREPEWPAAVAGSDQAKEVRS